MQGDIVNINGIWSTDNGDGTFSPVSDISLASGSPSPPIVPYNRPDANTGGITSWLNSAGAFGVSIASVLSGRPTVVQTPQGIYRTVPYTQAAQQQINVGGLLLLGLGILILVKVLS